jgi:hypothetical protein
MTPRPDAPETHHTSAEDALALAMRTAIMQGSASVSLYANGEVEIGGADDNLLLSLKGKFPDPAALGDFLSLPESVIEDRR